MKIVLKDQTEIKDVTVGPVQNMLELTMSFNDVMANVSKFMDPEVMSEITCYSRAWKTVYMGFNRLSHIDNLRNTNEMRVWMEGTENASISEPIALFDDMYMPKEVSDQNG